MSTNRPWPPLANPPKLATGDVHAWILPLDVSPGDYERLVATLSPDERQRASEFRLEEPRRRFVVARGALRTLLGSYLSMPSTEIEFTVEGNQKPRLAETQEAFDLRFNVSHSGELALIGVALGCEIGIDIERIRDIKNMEQLARRYFHPNEINDLLTISTADRNDAFLQCWTAKEAILKAVGLGIQGDLASFAVPLDNNWQGWIECIANRATGQRSRCWLERLAPHDDYVAAIACVESQRNVQSFTFAI